jgi:single-strand DNA-binding protein
MQFNDSISSYQGNITMANLNKVMLIGNLTRDPETKPVKSGSLTTFSIAVNRNYTTAAGEKKEETTFVDIESWGKQAELIAKYMKKGRPIFVEGRLKLDKWEDKETKKNRSALSVVMEDFQFIDTKKDEVVVETETPEVTEESKKAFDNLFSEREDKKINAALKEFEKQQKSK